MVMVVQEQGAMGEIATTTSAGISGHSHRSNVLALISSASSGPDSNTVTCRARDGPHRIASAIVMIRSRPKSMSRIAEGRSCGAKVTFHHGSCREQ